MERDLMEGWQGYRVVSSLIGMPIEHPEVMVWLLVGVRANGSAYGGATVIFMREVPRTTRIRNSHLAILH